MIEDLVSIAKEAGKKIMEFYEGDFEVEYKEDESPLTCADKAANEIICDFLREKYPDIPVLSEEDNPKDIPWDRFFAVDPLDGTKEFIGGKGEFTVNIALIENGEPVKGVIYIPNWDEVYYGEKGGGVNFEREKTDEKTGVVSRSHSGEEELAILEEMDVKKIVHVGSSIKFCWLASGKADVYVRKTPLMIWDMAAAYAICGEVGVQIRDFSGNRIDFSELTVPGIRAF